MCSITDKFYELIKLLFSKLLHVHLEHFMFYLLYNFLIRECTNSNLTCHDHEALLSHIVSWWSQSIPVQDSSNISSIRECKQSCHWAMKLKSGYKTVSTVWLNFYRIYSSISQAIFSQNFTKILKIGAREGSPAYSWVSFQTKFFQNSTFRENMDLFIYKPRYCMQT